MCQMEVHKVTHKIFWKVTAPCRLQMMFILKGLLVVNDCLKPAFEKISKEKRQQMSKNKQIICTYRIEVFAYKMTMNEISTTPGLRIASNFSFSAMDYSTEDLKIQFLNRPVT